MSKKNNDDDDIISKEVKDKFKKFKDKSIDQIKSVFAIYDINF